MGKIWRMLISEKEKMKASSHERLKALEGHSFPGELRQICTGGILFLRFLARERKESGKEKQKKEERPSWRAVRLRRSIL